MRKLRVYVDTCVVGAVFDKGLDWQTKQFWNAVRQRKIIVIVSDLLTDEVERAPKRVQDFFRSLPKSQIEHVVSTDESDHLAAQYIAENVVGKSSLDDCRHVALATLAYADVLVSWNLKHMANIERKKGYNGVNLKLGYPQIEILPPYPLEVIYAKK